MTTRTTSAFDLYPYTKGLDLGRSMRQVADQRIEPCDPITALGIVESSPGTRHVAARDGFREGFLVGYAEAGTDGYHDPEDHLELEIAKDWARDHGAAV